MRDLLDRGGTPMTLACALVRFLSVMALGLFAGAMLTEGAFLVPWWRALPPADFLAWYHANDQRLVGFFGALTTWTALLAIAAALLALWQGHPGRWLTLLAAVLTIAAVAMFFVYFRQANLSFATGSVGVENVTAELARWATWHWSRTVMSLVAFAAALLGLVRTT
jgi:hypothetical protein